jgi:hypothetical protein
LIIAPDGRIIGESVIDEIDWDLRSANFRIALCHTTELDVYSFNWRAEKAYL